MDTKGIQRISNVLSKHSPTLLTGLAVAGLVSTTVLAVKATPKALLLIQQEEEAILNGLHDEDVAKISLTPFDTIKLTWKCYLPAAITGVVTIACIIGANSVNLRRNAALAGLYSLSETALKEYKAKVVETIGKNKERAIKDEVVKEKIAKNPVSDKEIIVTGNGNTLCYDALSGRYFKSDIEQIRKALNDLGRDMLTDMTVTLNDVYYELGLKSSKMGDLIGWNVNDGMLEADFSSQLTDNGTPCLVLDFVTEPRYVYKD